MQDYFSLWVSLNNDTSSESEGITQCLLINCAYQLKWKQIPDCLHYYFCAIGKSMRSQTTMLISHHFNAISLVFTLLYSFKLAWACMNPTVANGITGSCNTTVGGSCTITCNSGYTPSSYVLVCGGNGVWHPQTTGSPTTCTRKRD